MQINATQIRVGNILDLEGELYRVTWTMHRTPGKGNAVMQTKLKHAISGKNMEKRFMSNERVEKAQLQTIEMQYLYAEGDSFIFMNNETYDQLPISGELIGDLAKILIEGDNYPVSFYDEMPVGVEFPKSITLKVTFAPPELKKATATSTLKPIELENGMTINAPGFIKEGDVIRINTDSMEYIERA